MSQPLLQQRHPSPGVHTPDCYRNGSLGTDQHNKLSTSRDRCIQEIALEQSIMLCMDRDDYGWILGPLAFVHGDSVRKDQFVQFVEIIRDSAAIKMDHNFLVTGIEAFDPTDVAVEGSLICQSEF